MQTRTHLLSCEDGQQIFVYEWLPEQPAKGILQISHGMAEHAGRYERLANFLTSAGWIVVANDHRGHGQNVLSGQLMGYFADENGWGKVVGDMHLLQQSTKEKFPDLPYFLLGHSMGALLAVRFAELHGSSLQGLILSALAPNPGFLASLGKSIAGLQSAVGRKVKISKLMHYLTFVDFNKKFEPHRTGFEWLSRDEMEVDKYVNDPLCGKTFTAGFFRDFMGGIKELYREENLKQIPKSLPIFMLSGSDDPVVGFSRGTRLAHEKIKSLVKDFQSVVYKEGRHESLNELNRNEVERDILNWLTQHIENDQEND